MQSGGESVGSAVSGIDDAVNRLPETGGWSGAAHEAANEMFGRADAVAQRFTAYTTAVAAALREGAGALGGAHGGPEGRVVDEREARPAHGTQPPARFASTSSSFASRSSRSKGLSRKSSAP